MRREKKSILIFGFIILILGAFFAPQLLFSVQDYYRMDKTWQGKRSSLDLQALNGSYDTLRERMLTFAKDVSLGEKYYVTGTDCEVTKEFYEIFDQMILQSELELLTDIGLLTFVEELYKIGFSVEAWKRYVIYNEGAFENNVASVAFHAWYMELAIDEKNMIKLLVDVESYTIYYIQWVDRTEGYGKVCEAETLVYNREALEYMAECYYYYYEAGYFQPFIYEEGLLNTELVCKEKELTEHDFEGNEAVFDKNVSKDEYISYSSGLESAIFTAKLPYADNVLIWELYVGDVQNIENGRTFKMGIKEIGELIPEFQES